MISIPLLLISHLMIIVIATKNKYPLKTMLVRMWLLI